MAPADTHNIIGPDVLKKVEEHLPIILKNKNTEWKLVYSLTRDGSSLKSFFSHCKDKTPTLIVVKTKKGEVLGGFTNTAWKVNVTPAGLPEFYGNPDSFLFKIDNNADHALRVFPWSSHDSYVMMSTDTSIGMGGAGNGFGLYISDDFLSGRSSASQTFHNDPLASKENFEILDFECWHMDKAKKQGVQQHGWLSNPFVLDINKLLHDITGVTKNTPTKMERSGSIS